MPEQRTITLRKIDSSAAVEVPADLYGPHLALHISIEGDEWTVTHVPTGGRIAGSMDRGVLEQLCRRLLPLRWDFTDEHAMPEATRRITLATLAEMKHLLSFKDIDNI